MESNPNYTSLIEMGCSAVLSQAAIKKLKSQDLMALLDWIQQHSEEEEIWKKWLEENKEVESQVKVENKTVSHLVNQQMSKVLQEKGNSKAVAQKALLFTSSVSVESALGWIQQHKYDPDFQEELILEGQSQQSNLSPQEAKQKLKELTQKARQIRKKREEEEERERERNRVRYGKQMIEAKRIAEEQAIKRQLQLDKIEKSRDEKYKKQLLQQMRKERQAKLGIKSTNNASEAKPQKQKQKLTKIQQLQIQCEQVKVGMHAYPDRAKVFFETAQIYVNNIIKNNGQQKYRKINKENKAFQSRICQVFAGVETLQVLGYEHDGNSLFMKNYEIGQLTKASSLFQRYKSYY